MLNGDQHLYGRYFIRVVPDFSIYDYMEKRQHDYEAYFFSQCAPGKFETLELDKEVLGYSEGS